MRKVCVVITARPSYSRIRTALKAIKEHEELELQLVVAASAVLDRYGNAHELIEADGFQIDARVLMVIEGESLPAMAKSTGIGLIELSTAFDNLKPDIVVTIADRYETMATAVAASYMNIPLVHIQGGEVTGSIDEKVRHAITKLADQHLVSSEESAIRVKKMGEDNDTIHVTGCPSIDLAVDLLHDEELRFDPIKKYGGIGRLTEIDDGYIVVLQHPVTTEYQSSLNHIRETCEAILNLNTPTLWFWPNVDAGSDGTSRGIRAFRDKYDPEKIRFFKNFEGIDFLKLIKNSKCLIGNSSVGIRESAFLGVPVVNIGSRQSGRQRGDNVVDVAHDASKIEGAVKSQMAHGSYPSQTIFGDGNGGVRIADCLARMPLKYQKRISY